MLIDNAETESLRPRGRRLVKQLSADFDRPRVRSQRAGGDRHQRRLACAILAQKGMHLAFDDLKADAAERDDAREGLHNVGEAQNGAGFALHLQRVSLTRPCRIWRVRRRSVARR